MFDTLEERSPSTRMLAVSPDGQLFATAHYDHTMRLWDARTGTLLSSLDGHSDSIMALAFTSDGKLLSSGSRDGTVRL